MKKWVLTLSVLTLGVVAAKNYFFTVGHDEADLTEDSEDQQNDKTPLVDEPVKVQSGELTGLSSEILADPVVQEIIAATGGDFQEFTFKNQPRLEQMIPSVVTLVTALKDCDSKNQCGETVQGQAGLKHQQLLAGALAFLGESYRLLGKRQDLSPENVGSLFEVNNFQVQSLASDLVVYSVQDTQALGAAVKHFSKLRDESVSLVAQATDSVSRQDGALRSAWVGALSQWLSVDTHNPEPFLSNLSFLELSESEFQIFAKTLCRYVGKEEQKETLAVLRVKVASYAQSQGWASFSEESCAQAQ